MDLIALDDRGQLYLAPDVDDWAALEQAGISAIFDLDGGLDIGVPTVPNHTVYLYFPFNDGALPDLTRLHAVGRFGAALVRSGNKVLSHCGLGYNRSALVAGMVLIYLGLTGPQAVEQIRARRPGALYNEKFASFLMACEPEP